MSLYAFGKALMRCYCKLFYRVTVKGLEHMPQQGGFIVCSNHRSNMDPVFLGVYTKPEISYMAKAELLRIPLVGGLLRRLHAFPVERGKGDTGALDTAVQVVQEGKYALGIFPEGHRSKDGAPLRPKSGVAIIANRTGADLLPVGIHIDGELRLFGRVEITYGPMIRQQELGFTGEASPREIKAASRMIMERISALAGVPEVNHAD